MEIITNRPIMTSEEWNSIDWETDLSAEDYSNFLTKKMRQNMRSKKAAKAGISKKTMRSSRRASRKLKRTDRRNLRKLNRAQKTGFFANLRSKTSDWWTERKKRFSANQLERQARRERRKKEGARELVINEEKSVSVDQPAVFNDNIPEVVTDANGQQVKQLADGSVEQLPANANLQTVSTPAGDQIVIDQNDLNGRQLTFDSQDMPVVEYQEQEVVEVRDENGKNQIVAEDQAEKGWWKSMSKLQKGMVIGGGVLVAAGITLLIINVVRKKSK